MTAPIRPARTFGALGRADQDRIRANLEKMQAQHAPDADVETYLRDVEGLAAVDAAPAGAEGSAAAGLFAAPLDAIPGVALARGTIGGLMDAAGNVLHGRPADVGGSVQRQLTRVEADRAQAAKVGGGFPAAGLEAAGMAASLPLLGAGAAMRASEAGASALNAARVGAAPAAEVAAAPAAQQALIKRVLAGRPAQNAFTGATWAGASRALAPTSESLTERARAAVDALPMGAAMGVGAPAVVGTLGGAAGLASAAKTRLTEDAESGALRLMARAAARSKTNLAEAAATAKPGEVAADLLGDTGRRLTRYAASVSSAGSEALTQFLESRGLGRANRLTQAAEQAIGNSRGDVVAQQAALEEARNAAAKTNFDIARDLPPVSDPAILAEFDADPVLRGAVDIARRIVGRATKTTQPPLTRTVTTTLLDAKGEPVHAPRTEYVPQSIAVLDLAKRTINDLVGKQLDNGSTVGHYEASISTGRLNDLLKQIDASHAPYGQARAQFSHDIKLEEALAKGLTTFAPGTLHEDVAAEFGNTIDDAKPYFRQGAARDLWGRTEGNDLLGNRSLAFHRTPNTEAKIRALAPSPAALAEYQDQLASETGQRKTEAMGLGGSPTARLQQDIRDAEGPSLGEIGSAAMSGVPGLAKLTLREMLSRRMQGITEKRVDALAPWLMAGRNGPEDYARLLEALRVFMAEPQRARLVQSRALARGAGVVAGSP
jgi:hypothetical protein